MAPVCRGRGRRARVWKPAWMPTGGGTARYRVRAVEAQGQRCTATREEVASPAVAQQGRQRLAPAWHWLRGVAQPDRPRDRHCNSSRRHGRRLGQTDSDSRRRGTTTDPRAGARPVGARSTRHAHDRMRRADAASTTGRHASAARLIRVAPSHPVCRPWSDPARGPRASSPRRRASRSTTSRAATSWCATLSTAWPRAPSP